MITEILPSALAVLGDRRFDDTVTLGDGLGEVRSIVVLLADGLGTRPALTPRLGEAFAAGRLTEQRCTLPSTTPTSLVSLGTGVTPGQHGVLGFRVARPGTDDVLTHLLWKRDPDPAVWAPQPTVFTRTIVDCSVVLPAAFADGGLTVAAYGGARYVGLARREDPVAAVSRTLAEHPGLLLTYTAAIDTAAHVHGVGSAQWTTACDETADLIERLVAALPPATALVVTADHGCLNVPSTSRLQIRDDPRLSAGLRVIAGEPRFRYLHAAPGAEDDLLAAWREVLGDRARVFSRAGAVEAGLFGPVREQFLDRIGDVVVVCAGDTAVFASGWEPDEMADLVGLHGSDSDVETAVPLVTYLR